MARPSKEQALADIHAEARRSFDRVQAAQQDERKQCVEDRRFYSIPGAMWEGPIGEMFENKPKMEINKVMLAVMRIITEYRNNRITVDFVSKDGTENDTLADTCDGLYRADEQDSCAEEAYDNAFEEAIGGGFGAWRLRACYEDEYDEENEKQRIRIEPIYDADTSVFFDLDAKKQDKSDAKECWVIYSITPAEYKALYNDDPASWPKETETRYFDWNTPDVVYIAEYYRVEEKRERVYVFVDAAGNKIKHTRDELEDMAEDADDPVEAAITMLADTGTALVSDKPVKRRRVRKYIMSGGKILEDCGYIAGKCIPIVPVYGRRWYVDNIERCMGAVRLAKDPTRLKNMQISKLAEISALSTVEKPIFHPEQIAGHQVMWSEDNIKNYPYLLTNLMEGPDGSPIATGPVAYTKVPNIPPAMAALLQLTDTDLAEILGRQQDGEKLESNLSGKAVELIQQRLDMQAFIYLSNFAKAMQRCGTIWLSMAEEVYVEDGRKMKAVGEAGNVESVELMKPVLDEKTGELVASNDLSKADFDVVVDVGPSFTSRRDATVRSLTNLIQVTSDPETQQILQAMILMNMEGEGLSEVREFYRKKLVALGVVQPNEEERKAMEEAAQQQQQPDPNSTYLLAEAEKSLAEAEKVKAETIYTEARTEGEQAKTLETLQKIGEPTAPQAG